MGTSAPSPSVCSTLRRGREGRGERQEAAAARAGAHPSSPANPSARSCFCCVIWNSEGTAPWLAERVLSPPSPEAMGASSSGRIPLVHSESERQHIRARWGRKKGGPRGREGTKRIGENEEGGVPDRLKVFPGLRLVISGPSYPSARSPPLQPPPLPLCPPKSALPGTHHGRLRVPPPYAPSHGPICRFSCRPGYSCEAMSDTTWGARTRKTPALLHLPCHDLLRSSSHRQAIAC